jgi:hypothetical protein
MHADESAGAIPRNSSELKVIIEGGLFWRGSKRREKKKKEK